MKNVRQRRIGRHFMHFTLLNYCRVHQGVHYCRMSCIVEDLSVKRMALGTRFVNKLILYRNIYPVAKYSTTVDDHNVIVTTDDQNVIVCWHPEKEFPYEHTLPIPEKAAIAESHFKIQTSKALQSLYKPKTEDDYRAELMKLTNTTHHKWFIRKWDFRKKKEPKFPRPYL